MIVVSDTSVITSLLQIGREHLLQEIQGGVLIPPTVHRELLRTHVRIPTFLEIRAVEDLSQVARLRAVLDSG